MDPNVFLRRMVRRQPSLRKGIDAVGCHPYQMASARMRSGIVRLRQTMNSLRMGSTPIEITEIGMTTAWVPEAVRANAIGKLARALPADRKLNVTRFIPYEWASSHQGDDFGQYWGIMNADGTPTPTGTAYLSAIAARSRSQLASSRRKGRATAGGSAPA